MKTKSVTVLLLLVILLVGSMPLGCGWGPHNSIKLTIINNTDNEINVFVFLGSITAIPHNIGTLSPGQSKKSVFERDWVGVRSLDVLALDTGGYLAFYRVFWSLELQETLRGKVTITDEPAWRETP